MSENNTRWIVQLTRPLPELGSRFHVMAEEVEITPHSIRFYNGQQLSLLVSHAILVGFYDVDAFRSTAGDPLDHYQCLIVKLFQDYIASAQQDASRS